MKSNQSDAIANILNSRDTPPLLEGLELVRAFSKIRTGEDRQKVIDLAKRLATTNA
jgi:hypothetical protein